MGDTDEHVEQLCWGTTEQVTTTGSRTASADNNNRKLPHQDDQEPLALLVVHAAMHMLFLPQFTCDYYEDTSQPPPESSTTKPTTASSAAPSADEKHMKELKLQANLPPRPTVVESGVSLVATPTSILWAAGVGVSDTAKLGFDASTRKYDKHRIEVLRLLLTACSDPLYSPADAYNPLASRWLAVATAADAPNGPCLFYSLLNTILIF